MNSEKIEFLIGVTLDLNMTREIRIRTRKELAGEGVGEKEIEHYVDTGDIIINPTFKNFSIKNKRYRYDDDFSEPEDAPARESFRTFESPESYTHVKQKLILKIGIIFIGVLISLLILVGVGMLIGTKKSEVTPIIVVPSEQTTSGSGRKL